MKEKHLFYIGQKVTIMDFEGMIVGPNASTKEVHEIIEIYLDDQGRQYMVSLDSVSIVYCWRLLPVDDKERAEVIARFKDKRKQKSNGVNV
ncbi:MAG: hypothetical protein ACRC23_02085 [Aeromonas jandaei]